MTLKWFLESQVKAPCQAILRKVTLLEKKVTLLRTKVSLLNPKNGTIYYAILIIATKAIRKIVDDKNSKHASGGDALSFVPVVLLLCVGRLKLKCFFRSFYYGGIRMFTGSRRDKRSDNCKENSTEITRTTYHTMEGGAILV